MEADLHKKLLDHNDENLIKWFEEVRGMDNSVSLNKIFYSSIYLKLK